MYHTLSSGCEEVRGVVEPTKEVDVEVSKLGDLSGDSLGRFMLKSPFLRKRRITNLQTSFHEAGEEGIPKEDLLKSNTPITTCGSTGLRGWKDMG